MKKLVIGLSVFLSLVFINADALEDEHVLIFDNLNTINFKEKIGNIDTNNIKMLCTYEYCDLVDLTNMSRGLDIYTNNYLKHIISEEDKKIIKVKGLKITKIVLEK